MTAVVVAIWIAGFVASFAIARRSPRAGRSILWYLILGPVGLLITLYGLYLDRAYVAREAAAPATKNPEIDVPVEVLVAGEWQPGRLRDFRTIGEQWQGSVSIAGSEPVWFAREHVRPVEEDA